jgi:hypothetical protein
LPVPLALSVPPAFSVTTEGTATREATAAGTTIVVEAKPKFTLEAALELKAAVEAKVECTLGIGELTFTAPGLLGVFFGGDFEFSIGVEIGGSVTLTEVKIGGKAELNTSIGATLTCPATAGCSLSGTSSATGTFEPVLEAPSLNQARFEPTVSLFGGIKLEAGNAFIEALQFEAIEAKAGLELGASLALEGLQIDNTDAEDGRSNYELAFKGEVGPGIKLGEFLSYVGLKEFVPVKFEFGIPLGSSPTGTVKADKPRYLPGDQIELTVTLAAASTIFPASIGTYNVKRVVIVRRDGLTTELLAEHEPNEGDTVFEFSFRSPALIDADELFAFVVTSLLPLDPPKLEIGPAAPPILFTFDRNFEGWSRFGIGPRSNDEPWGTTEWQADGGGTVRLSGVGGQGKRNSAMSKSIALPADATTLDFKASADLGHSFADSRLIVRIVTPGGSTTLLRKVYSNTTNRLQFTEESLDISAFAGTTVSVIFEQDDDGDGEHEHVYLDDIGIGTGAP